MSFKTGPVEVCMNSMACNNVATQMGQIATAMRAHQQDSVAACDHLTTTFGWQRHPDDPECVRTGFADELEDDHPSVWIPVVPEGKHHLKMAIEHNTEN